MTNLTDDPAVWRESYARISDNRITFDVWLAHLPKWQPLPTPTVEPRADGVYVFLSNPDDLAEWFEIAGGVVERGPEWRGTRTWLLTIDTGPEFRGLAVQVSVAALADAQVMHTLVDAARLATPLNTALGGAA